jgi:hypothetical protein
VPLKPAPREADGGLRFLEEKLSIYVQGANARPGHRRNPALDLLTGRVPDHRVQPSVGAPVAPAWPIQATDHHAQEPADLRAAPAWPIQTPDHRVQAPGGLTAPPAWQVQTPDPRVQAPGGLTAMPVWQAEPPNDPAPPAGGASATAAWQLQPPAGTRPAAQRARTPQTVVIPMPAVALAPRPGASPLMLAPAVAAHRASPSPWLQPSSALAPAPRIRFDGPVSRPLVPWAVGRGLLVPLALAMVLLGGIGAVLGLVQQPPETVAIAPPAITPAAVPTAEPTPAPVVVVEPAGEIDPAPGRPTAVPQPPAPAPVPSDQLGVVLDERFASNTRGWPDNPDGPSWLADGAYHLFARQTARYVAVSVPGAQNLDDVVVSGRFRKTGGPPGGGYGLIVRDQAQSADRGDGQSQAGPFYVFEVGDKGELGVWLRDGDHWVDLLPWTASDAIRPGLEPNDLTVSAIGDRLNFLVNGIPVATQLDTLLHHGGVAVFTGGDGNQVALERLTVRTPRS